VFKKITRKAFLFVLVVAMTAVMLPTVAIADTKGYFLSVAAGEYHSFAIKADGGLWAWGRNDYGQFGNDTKTSAKEPIKIIDNVFSVSAGEYHSFAIKTDGSLWAWGRNGNGRLGDSTNEDKQKPVNVMNNVVSVAAGHRHSIAIKTDGSLWTWGWSDYGQTGDSKITSVTPVKIMDSVVSVAAGSEHSLAIKTDGSLWAWGQNNNGEVGNGKTTSTEIPVKIIDGAVSVTAGEYHSFAIKTDGSLWAWGRNANGQLGIGTNTDANAPVKVMDSVVSVAAGSEHSLAIKSDGSLWAWGQNNDGQLGNGANINANTPIKVMDSVVSIAAGSEYSLAIKTDGSLWTWGRNSFGQLGDGTTINRNSPVKIMDSVKLPSIKSTPTTPVPTPSDVPEYNGLVNNGVARYNQALAIEGIRNATTAYGDFWWATAKIDGKVYDENYLKERGYYDVVCMNNGVVLDNKNDYDKPSILQSRTNAIFALKKIKVDGKDRILINISIAGTQSAREWFRDFKFAADSKGLHSGFSQNATTLKNAEYNVIFPSLDNISLGKIISDIGNGVEGSDKYLIFVNGHSLGAAVANIYTQSLFERRVPNTSLVGYTFATPLPAKDFNASSTPVFNVLNDDDPITKLGAGAITGSRFGIDRRYSPTDDFRNKNYGSFVPQNTKPLFGLPEAYIRVRHEQRTYLIIVEQGLVSAPAPTPTPPSNGNAGANKEGALQLSATLTPLMTSLCNAVKGEKWGEAARLINQIHQANDQTMPEKPSGNALPFATDALTFATIYKDKDSAGRMTIFNGVTAVGGKVVTVQVWDNIDTINIMTMDEKGQNMQMLTYDRSGNEVKPFGVDWNPSN
jgi:alpha-tubulin suppressor-like RCC1 family protein